MNYQRKIPHKFNLTGCKAGDWFMGCPECWFRHEANTASTNQCPTCQRRTLRIYDVTKEDVTASAAPQTPGSTASPSAPQAPAAEPPAAP